MASARPYFTVKTEGDGLVDINLFVEKNLPIEDIIIYKRSLKEDEQNFDITPVIIGTKMSGDKIHTFKEKSSEMVVVSCTTYYDEKIYFEYYLGEFSFHYRVVSSEQKQNATMIGLNREYVANGCLEIYKKSVGVFEMMEEVPIKRFIQYRIQFEKVKKENKIGFIENTKLLELFASLERPNLGSMLFELIELLRQYYIINSQKIFDGNIVQLLITLDEILNDGYSSLYISFPHEIDISDRLGTLTNPDNEFTQRYRKIIENKLECFDYKFFSNFIKDFVNSFSRQNKVAKRDMMYHNLRLLQAYVKGVKLEKSLSEMERKNHLNIIRSRLKKATLRVINS